MDFIKNKYKIILGFIFVLSYLACSSLSGPIFKPVSNIPANQSIVYLYRSSDDKNTEFTMKYNNNEICVLERGGYFPVFVREGKVEISATLNFKLFSTALLDLATSSPSNLVFKADPGKSYYVECQSSENNKDELVIKLVPENYGINKIKECKLLDPIEH